MEYETVEFPFLSLKSSRKLNTKKSITYYDESNAFYNSKSPLMLGYWNKVEYETVFLNQVKSETRRNYSSYLMKKVTNQRCIQRREQRRKWNNLLTINQTSYEFLFLSAISLSKKYQSTTNGLTIALILKHQLMIHWEMEEKNVASLTSTDILMIMH